jgi:hypothetical protein
MRKAEIVPSLHTNAKPLTGMRTREILRMDKSTITGERKCATRKPHRDSDSDSIRELSTKEHLKERPWPLNSNLLGTIHQVHKHQFRTLCTYIAFIVRFRVKESTYKV